MLSDMCTLTESKEAELKWRNEHLESCKVRKIVGPFPFLSQWKWMVVFSSITILSTFYYLGFRSCSNSWTLFYSEFLEFLHFSEKKCPFLVFFRCLCVYFMRETGAMDKVSSCHNLSPSPPAPKVIGTPGHSQSVQVNLGSECRPPIGSGIT